MFGKVFYRICYSDVKGKDFSHVPLYCLTKFRSFERAMKEAKKLHKENRDFTLLQINEKGCVTAWELRADQNISALKISCYQ